MDQIHDNKRHFKNYQNKNLLFTDGAINDSGNFNPHSGSFCLFLGQAVIDLTSNELTRNTNRVR